MADKTKIEWTDATWNPITGCTIVSPGCTNCYAMRLAGTRLMHHPSRAGLTIETKAGPVWNGKVRFNERALSDPLRWTKPRMIFVCAHGDLFHESVPDAWIDRIFAVMALSPQHTFQVLTKRPERMRAYFAETWQVPARDALKIDEDLTIPAQPARTNDRWSIINEAIDELTLDNPLFDQNRFWTSEGSLIGRPAWPRRPLPNVWLGVSVEDQRRADERIPILLDTPAAVRWVSAEPLLGPINFLQIPGAFRQTTSMIGAMTNTGWHHVGLSWVVAGGESGLGARPMHPDWPRSLRDQCASAGVPFLFKQWGEWLPSSAIPDPWRYEQATVLPDGRVREWQADYPDTRLTDQEMRPMCRFGKKGAGRMLDGVIHDGFPEARR